MTTDRQARGTLYLVPTPLDHGCEHQAPLADVLPQGTIAVAARLSHWISENAKSTRAFLKRVDALVPLAQPVQAQQIQELPRQIHKQGDHRPTGSWDARPLLVAALQGQDMGLVSEAGMPAVADPGSSVVRAAHELGIAVQPLVGPVSLMLALAASGLNGQDFAFAGYLAQHAGERTRQIQELSRAVHHSGQTRILIETPYRNPALLEALVTGLDIRLRLCVASGLTLPGGKIHCATVSNWRQHRWPIADRLPAIFLIGR